VPTLTLATSVVALAAITACVAVCSEFLTGAIEDFTKQTGLSQAFVGMVRRGSEGGGGSESVCRFLSHAQQNRPLPLLRL
jgi:hypothetical protein